MNIYEIGYNSYWTGRIDVISTGQGAPTGWTRTTVPTLSAGQYAKWLGAWTITATAPIPIPQAFDATRLTKEISVINAASRLIQTQRIMAQLVAEGQI